MNKDNLIKEKNISINLLKIIEEKYLKEKSLLTETNEKLQVGDIIRLGYIIPEGDKERTQYYEGLIISISNRVKDIGENYTAAKLNAVPDLLRPKAFFVLRPNDFPVN